jgi:hypothetical protein
MTIWSLSIALYLGLAIVTFLPTLKALVSSVKLNEDGRKSSAALAYVPQACMGRASRRKKWGNSW